MKRYEYKRETVTVAGASDRDAHLIAALNALGHDGWAVVSFEWVPQINPFDYTARLLLMRELADTQQAAYTGETARL